MTKEPFGAVFVVKTVFTFVRVAEKRIEYKLFGFNFAGSAARSAFRMQTSLKVWKRPSKLVQENPNFI